MNSDKSTNAGRETRRLALIGIGWTAGQTWLGVVIQIAMLIVLSRLISPKEFGDYAIALAFASLFATLAEFGIGAAIVRTRHEVALFARAATGIALLNSILATAGLIAIANSPGWLPAAGENTASLLLALAPVVVVAPLQAVSLGLLQRRRQFATMAIIEGVALFVNALVSVATAVAGWGAWALVFGHVSQKMTSAAGAWSVARPAGPSFARAETVNLLRFSFGFVWLRLIDVAWNTLDRLVVSAVAGSVSVGFYQRASNVRVLVGTLTMHPMDVYFFPRIAAGLDKPEILRREVDHALAGTLLMTAPLSVGIAVAAEQWIPILLGEPWAPAAPLVQIMALTLPFRAVDRVNAVLARSTGRQAARITIQFTGLALALVALYLLAGYSMIMAVSAVCTILVVMVLPSIALNAVILQAPLLAEFRALLRPLGLWVLCVGIGFGLKEALELAVPAWIAAFCAAVAASLSNLILSCSVPHVFYAPDTASRIEQIRNQTLSITSRSFPEL